MLPPLACLSVGVPVGVLYPLVSEEFISSATFYVFLSISLFAFVAYSTVLALGPLKSCLMGFKDITVSEMIKVVYTIMMISSVFLLSYLISHEDSDAWQVGAGVSSLILLLIAYLYTKMLFFVDLYNKSHPKSAFLDIILKKAPITEAFNKSLQKKRQVQLGIVTVGFFIPAVILSIVLLSLIHI